MTFGYSELQKCLSQWPKLPVPRDSAKDSLMERIRQILFTAREGGLNQKADLQVLFRHLLLRESLRSDTETYLSVPAHSSWPSAQDWNAYCVSSLPGNKGELLLTAKPWHPTWLGSGDSGVFADAFSSKIVREDGRCPADPFITDATGHKHYSSPGQREAVRAAFLMPPGHTLIVNLPTGSGKSLVGQAPALVNHRDGNLTLFVVPTVSLAIDQARQMEKYFSKSGTSKQTWPLAWYSGISEADCAEIRRRIREGTQRILFTSPESLTTSLLRTVFETASNDMLRYLIIDEAHLVTQWGDEFRPAFQALTGLRNSLLRQVGSNPFRTLLLSATFTQETVETLATLFGPPDRVQMVSAVHLRPEPQYWSSHANSPVDKKARVLEALRHAPRPFILYVTTRADALEWYRILKDEAGYHRIERFDGTTPSKDREIIIRDWIKNKIDGVVATSAFGVGIDKDDVRTIIHATIPETLDRFYQEVGRSGRDGKPSVSLLVFDDSDWKLPTGLATPAIISNELGFARWKALYDSRTGDGELFRVNIEAIRQGLKGNNDENMKWNMRTLLLMCRAGFLELDVEPSKQATEEVTDHSSNTSPLAAMTVIRIRMLRDDHLLPEVWGKIVSSSREKTLKGGKRNLHLLRNFLLEGSEIAATLAELYRIKSPQWPVDVTQVCGGCPSDRFNDQRNDRYHVPVAAPILNVVQGNFEHWKLTFQHLDPRHVTVFYETEMPLHLILSFIKWLVGECGIQELCADDRSALAQSSDWRQLYRYAPSGVVVHRSCQQLDEEPYSPLARLTFFDGRVTAQEIHKVLLLQRPLHLVLLQNNTPDPNHPLRRLSDTATNSTRLEQLNAVINQ